MERKTSSLSFSIDNILYGRPSQSKATEGRRSWNYCNQNCGIIEPTACTIRGCCQECPEMGFCVSESYSDRIRPTKHRNSFEDLEGKRFIQNVSSAHEKRNYVGISQKCGSEQLCHRSLSQFLKLKLQAFFILQYRLVSFPLSKAVWSALLRIV